MYGCNASWVIEQAVRKYKDLYPQRYDCRKWNKTSLSMHCVFCHYAALHFEYGVQRKYRSLWSTVELLQKYKQITNGQQSFCTTLLFPYCILSLNIVILREQYAKCKQSTASKKIAVNHCNEYHYSIQVCSLPLKIIQCSELVKINITFIHSGIH